MIIGRAERRLHQYLRERFREEPHVEVFFDRRLAARRRHHSVPAVERRHADRRRNELDTALSRHGWVVVRTARAEVWAPPPALESRPDDDLMVFLATRDAPYCFRCLAAAFPHRRVRQELESAHRAGAPIVIGDGLCAICHLTTTVVAYLPGSPDLARLIRRI